MCESHAVGDVILHDYLSKRSTLKTRLGTCFGGDPSTRAITTQHNTSAHNINVYGESKELQAPRDYFSRTETGCNSVHLIKITANLVSGSRNSQLVVEATFNKIHKSRMELS